MKRLLVIFGALLSACNSPAPMVETEVSHSVSGATQEHILQIPDSLSIPSFAAMKLEGTDLTLEFVEADTASYTRHAISYLSNELKITGVLLIPKGEGPFPLLILNHGYIDPAIYTRGRGLKREQDRLAREGFAVLHTDYRGHAGSDPSPMTEDVYDGNLEYAMDSANAILAMREAKDRFPTVDTERVGMMGHSLGGGVTQAILSAKPDLVDAAVFYAPVSSNVWENFTRWRSLREQGDNTRAKYGNPESHPAFWENLSPQSFTKSIRAPVLIVHGDQDDDVPKAWSDRLAMELETVGKDVEYLELIGEKHEFIRQWEVFMSAVTDFFDEHLRQ